MGKKNFKKKNKRTEEENIRLNKYIANSGICSRREADKLIESGLIQVNGEVVKELGTKVSSEDEVRYKGQPLKNEKPVYILLNKPKDVVTTVKDKNAPRTVIDLVKHACPERV